MPRFNFPHSQLAIIPALEEAARKQAEERGEELDEDTDLIDWFCEGWMEDLSEAGYTECRPNDRLSTRAFGRLLKVIPGDKRRIRAAIGYEPSAYRKFAWAGLATYALSLQKEYALGLAEACNGGLKSVGPFGESKTLELVPHLVSLGLDYQMEVGDLPDTEEEFTGIYLAHLVNEYSGVTSITDEKDISMVKLASILRIGDIDKLVGRLRKAGLKDEAGLTLAVACTAIGALRVDRKFSYGVSSSQYRESN